MKVTHVELLERCITPTGRCRGKMCVHGDGGESIRVECDIPYFGIGGMAAINSALAQDAMRQLRRLPEFRRNPPQEAEFAMPKWRKKRVVQISAR
ncbi:MAG: hypothetical protein ACRBBQ_04265 [Cognatishimia sp.]